ncbi:MAG: D-alanyl-D-alanine carboxypeptidase family protein [Caldicoprobacterales bacterium]
MKKMGKLKKATIIKSFLLLLLAAILFASSIALTAPAFASVQEETEIENSDPDTDTGQDTEQDTSTNPTDTDDPASSQFDSIAKAAILMEASTGKVLYEKNADEALPPASITKIMTLLLGFEALERGDASWDDMVTISERAWKEEGSIMFLEVDTQVRLEDIMTGISVVSANDGCIALAEHLNGSVEAFVREMNKRAQELGLSNTQYQNPNGLPAQGHYMSARDIATLARELIISHPKILEIESITEFTFNEIKQLNRNPLLGIYPGADGLKTGWTEEAGYCLVGTAKQNGMRLISVVLKTNDEDERLAASRELLDYGYQNFELSEVVKAGDDMGQGEVKNGKELTVPLKADETIKIVIQRDRKEEIKVNLSMDEEMIQAPVESDKKVGKADFLLDGELLASTPISTAQDVEKAGFFEIIWRAIITFFRSLFQVSTGE